MVQERRWKFAFQHRPAVKLLPQPHLLPEIAETGPHLQGGRTEHRPWTPFKQCPAQEPVHHQRRGLEDHLDVFGRITHLAPQHILPARIIHGHALEAGIQCPGLTQVGFNLAQQCITQAHIGVGQGIVYGLQQGTNIFQRLTGGFYFLLEPPKLLQRIDISSLPAALLAAGIGFKLVLPDKSIQQLRGVPL